MDVLTWLTFGLRDTVRAGIKKHMDDLGEILLGGMSAFKNWIGTPDEMRSVHDLWVVLSDICRQSGLDILEDRSLYRWHEHTPAVRPNSLQVYCVDPRLRRIVTDVYNYMPIYGSNEMRKSA